MFASQTKSVVEHDGHTIEYRKLSGRQLEEASDVRQNRVAATARSLGPEMFKSFTNEAKEKKAETTAAKSEDRLAAYDRATVLRYGVLSVDGQRINPSQVDDFDETAAAVVSKAILELTLPTVEAVQEAEGKD